MGLLIRVAALLLFAGIAPAAAVEEETLPEGSEVARRINARSEGEASVRRLVMELHDKRGGVRTRETLFFRRSFEDGTRTVLFFTSPANLKDTAFLSWDYADAEATDDQWLYLPALRKGRRIATRDRGKSFLGTDLSYEDVKKQTRVSPEEYRWRTIGREEVDGLDCVVVEATPVDAETADELGYGRVVLSVDTEIWMARKAVYQDVALRPLKTSRVLDVREIDGVWTPHRIEVANEDGHRTVFRMDDVRYDVSLPDDLFTERALGRGPPAL
jgi:hypothetical protein